MYNSYEEYMQNVLGMNFPNTYMQNNNYYEVRNQDTNLQEVNKYYPEIYGVVYPLVQKVCSRRSIGIVNENQINEMVEEIYNIVEPSNEGIQSRESVNAPKNGDVKNPRAKDTVNEPRRSNNYLLRDLIRILIIRELLQGNFPGGMPRPPMMGGPGGMPGGRPPIIRPGYMGM